MGDKFKNLGIKGKLLLFFVALVLIVSLGNIIISQYSLNKNLTSDLLNRAVIHTKSMKVSLIDPLLIRNKNKISEMIFDEKNSQKDIAYIIVFDESNNLLASTLVNEFSKEDILKNNVLPEGGNENTELISFEEGMVYDTAVRFEYGKGILRVGYYKNYIDESIKNITVSMIISSIVSIFIAIIFAFIFAGIILNPINKLKDIAIKVAQGNLKERISIKSKDEFGYFATIFNQMLDSLEKSHEELKNSELGLEQKVKERTAELEGLKNNLEKIVEERTKELQTKLEELERFHDLTVGREMKMIELKKEIERLKAK